MFEIVGRHCHAVVKGKLRKDGPAGIQGPAKRVRFDLNEDVAKAVKDCKALMTEANLLLQKQLEEWRNSFTIKLAKHEHKTSTKESLHTMAVLCRMGA